MNETEARAIAEATCIKGGKATNPDIYNETQDVWVFSSNLNSTRPGCIPYCTVNAPTKTAVLEWKRSTINK